MRRAVATESKSDADVVIAPFLKDSQRIRDFICDTNPSSPSSSSSSKYSKLDCELITSYIDSDWSAAKRYLDSSNGDLLKATNAMLSTVKWRKTFHAKWDEVDTDEWPKGAPRVNRADEFDRAEHRGHDIYGRPVAYVIGSKHIAKEHPTQDTTRSFVQNMDTLVARMKAPATRCVIINDQHRVGPVNADFAAR